MIDVAYMTNTKNGKRMRVIRNAKIIYAHFHFISRPQTNTLTFKWQKPGNPKVRFTGFATKRYSTTVDTFVCVKSTAGGSCLNVALATGKKLYDRRDDLKKKAELREVDQAMKARRK